MAVFQVATRIAAAMLFMFQFSSAAYAGPMVAFGGDAGTLGLGGHAVVEFKPWLNGRMSAHLFNYATDLNLGGLNYDSNIQLRNFGSYADFYPFAGKARLSLGALYNGNKIKLHKTCTDGCSVDGMTVVGPNVQLDGSLSFNKLAPYVGIGWGNAMSGSPFYVLFDAGVVFQGAPKVDLNASGVASVGANGYWWSKGMDLQTDPVAQLTLDDERTQIRNGASRYQYFPVVSFSIGWRL